METLKYVSPEYEARLKQLASLLCPKVEEYRPSPHDVEDIRLGFDLEGNYHHPALKLRVD